MPKFHRGSAPPSGALLTIRRNERLFGTRDEQIEAAAERSRGCPDPDRAIVYTRRPRTSRATSGTSKSPVPDTTPREHARKVAMLERNMDAMATAVRIARDCGDDEARRTAADRARALRAEWVKLTGGVERRVIEVDQGSAVNPMIAV